MHDSMYNSQQRICVFLCLNLKIQPDFLVNLVANTPGLVQTSVQLVVIHVGPTDLQPHCSKSSNTTGGGLAWQAELQFILFVHLKKIHHEPLTGNVTCHFKGIIASGTSNQVDHVKQTGRRPVLRNSGVEPAENRICLYMTTKHNIPGIVMETLN